MKAARVLVVDDHEITRIGLESVFETEKDYKLCARAIEGRTAVEMARRLMPDLVLLDIGLPNLNGLDAARQMISNNPGQCILVFTEIDSERTMREALESGIRGYVLKSDRICDLLTAVDAVLNGRTFFTSRMTEMVLALAKSQSREIPVSGREREVIQLVAEGHGINAIAEILCVSPKTVDTHRTNIKRKLNISSTADLVLYAIRNEIVRIPELKSSTPKIFGSRPALYRVPGRASALPSRMPAEPGPVPISASGDLRLAAHAGAGD